MILIESRYDGALQGQDCNVALRHLRERERERPSSSLSAPTSEILIVRESSSKLLQCVYVYVCVCECVSHPEGLIETVVLVSCGEIPRSCEWKGYNLGATQHTTGNSSSRAIKPPLKDKYCINTEHMATQGISALFSTHTHTHTHTQECVGLHDFQRKDVQHRPTNMLTYRTAAHTGTGAHTHPARD